MMHKPDKKENTSEEESEAEDFDQYRQKIMNRADAVDKVYRKKINKDPVDLADEDYWKMQKEYKKTVDDYFAPENLKIDPLNASRIDKTKRLVRALRVNNTFDFVREKNVDAITNEYNNYEKFHRNYTYYKDNEKNAMIDDASSHIKNKLSNYIGSLTPYGEYQETKEYKLRVAEVVKKPLSSEYYERAEIEQCNFEEQILNDEIEIQDKTDVIYGRMSPHAKESMYQLYNDGWTINDLAFKFGILPNRVKAIVWSRRYFYDEVAPNIDRTI